MTGLPNADRIVPVRAIEKAVEEGAAAFGIRIETPGGFDESMRDLVKEILAARIPVETFAYPDGARVASAGT